ncbi:Helix-loop-helix DNA-binding domain protein [Aphelenchoides besseyi]|nr:Helix-loop-helix DNA-binding domain protein [Aphelenchoides besseyi]
MDQLHYQLIATDNVEELELPARSTRGASKHRRDQINIEIQRLRDLLPLNSCVKDRLFQLQVMSLACIYLRKQSYLPHVVLTCEKPIYPLAFSTPIPKDINPYKAIRGFMLMSTFEGKLLHLSDNASEYLGFSVVCLSQLISYSVLKEEIMCQGDAIYDLIDVRDHQTVQSVMNSGPSSAFDTSIDGDRAFVCRMNLSRTAKRQVQHYKLIVVEGRYIHPLEYYKTVNSIATVQPPIQPIFAAFCTPLLTLDNVETISQGNTETFTSVHTMDMHFVDIDEIGTERLGFSVDQIQQLNWYDLIHPDQLPAFAERHHLLCREREGSIVSLTRLETEFGEWIWLHSVLTIKNANSFDGLTCQPFVIINVLTIIIPFSDIQAYSLRNSPWIYATKHYESFRDPQKHFELLDCGSSPDSTQNQSSDFGIAAPQIRVKIPKTFQHYEQSFDPNNNQTHDHGKDSISEVNSKLKFDYSLHSNSTTSGIFSTSSLHDHCVWNNCFVLPTSSIIVCRSLATVSKNISDKLNKLQKFHHQLHQLTVIHTSQSLKRPPSGGIKREFSSPPLADNAWWPLNSNGLWTHFAEPSTTLLPSVHSLNLGSNNSQFQIKRQRSSIISAHLNEKPNENNNSWSPNRCGNQTINWTSISS